MTHKTASHGSRKYSLDQEAQIRFLEAKLVEIHFAHETNHASFLKWFANPKFFSLLDNAQRILKLTSLEVGMTWSLKKDPKQKILNPAQAHWGEIVLGDQMSITQKHDPFAEYFVHGRGNVPLMMLHFHPSKRLGFSREDCLTAISVLQETKGMLKGVQGVYRPIFAVGVLLDSNTMQILMVQSNHIGKFIEFKNLGKAYDAWTWLSCPYFNAAILEFTKKGEVWISRIKENTGIMIPFT